MYFVEKHRACCRLWDAHMNWNDTFSELSFLPNARLFLVLHIILLAHQNDRVRRQACQGSSTSDRVSPCCLFTKLCNKCTLAVLYSRFPISKPQLIRPHISYIEDAIMAPYTFEQLRTASVGHVLGPLVKSLSDRRHHPDLVSALLLDAILIRFLDLIQINIC